MKQLQKEVAELRKKNEKSLKVAIAGSGWFGDDPSVECLVGGFQRLIAGIWAF